MDININNSINCENEIIEPDIVVNTITQNNGMTFDVILLKDLVKTKKEQYYRMYIRPNFNSYTFRHRYKNNDPIRFNYAHSREGNIVKYKDNSNVQFTIEHNGVTEIIKGDRKDGNFTLNDFQIEYKNGQNIYDNWNFQLIKIPAEYVSLNSINKISFSATFAVAASDIDIHQSQGTIEFDMGIKTTKHKYKDYHEIKFLNTGEMFVNIDHDNKEYNIKKIINNKDVRFYNNSYYKNLNYVPIINLDYKNNFNNLNYTYIGKNMETALKLINEDVSSNEIPQVKAFLSYTGGKIKDFYDINEDQNRIYKTKYGFGIEPLFYSHFDLEQNKVIDNGDLGIALNPNIDIKISYSQSIKINGYEFSLIHKIDNKKINEIIEYKEIDSLKYHSAMFWNREKISKVDFNNNESIIEYIKENQY